MKPGSVAIIGAAETALGKVPHLGELELRVDAAHRAIADAGLTLADIDGVATAVASPIEVAHCLGISPSWYDGTTVGGCSFLVHVRHAVSAISSGLCTTVLITHGESGRSGIGKPPFIVPPHSMRGQFEIPYGADFPARLFPLPIARFLHETGTTHEQLATVPAVQSRWAQGNPRAWRNKTVTTEDVLASPLVSWPIHQLQCCVVTDGGGALILTSRERANAGASLPPVYVLGTGEASDSPLVSFMEDFTSSAAFRRSSAEAFRSCGLGPADVDHLMVYDAFAHLPLYGLEDLGFVARGEAGAFIAEGNTAPGGRLPMNTNGGGLCYTHTGMYGMFEMIEAVRQLRGEAFRQVPNVEVSFVQGVGSMFTAAASLVLSNRAS